MKRLGVIDGTVVYPECRHEALEDDLDREVRVLLEAAGLAVVADDTDV